VVISVSYTAFERSIDEHDAININKNNLNNMKDDINEWHFAM
jgi:hypothetical protein